MKKRIFLLTLLLISNIAVAAPLNKNMSGLSVVRLSEINENSVAVTVDLPGYSKVCGLAMRGDNFSYTLSKNFAGLVQFTNLNTLKQMDYDVNASGEFIFKLNPDTYVDGVIVTTVNKNSLASNVAAAFPDKTNDVGFIEILCS